jgi:hypothetical protein
MSALRSVSIALAISVATVASAADFDGTLPLTCEAQQAHDCLPSQNTCSALKPQTDIAPIFGIDFAKKQVRSPYRTSILPILHTTTNEDSLVMQGADLLVAWSALIDKKTGALTVSIADSAGSYVAFGQCKASKAK